MATNQERLRLYILPHFPHRGDLALGDRSTLRDIQDTLLNPSACRPTTPGPTSTTAASASRSPPPHQTPPHPQTHTPSATAKVERYQQTLAREWAYGQRYRNSNARAKALPIWLNHYNTTRNHSSLGDRPPITRVHNQPRHNTFSWTVSQLSRGGSIVISLVAE
jgi:hypothetical protein